MDASITIRVNGEEHALAIDTRTTLLDLLREHLGLTGAKKGCDHGQCGACTVLLDGRRVNSLPAARRRARRRRGHHGRGARGRRAAAPAAGGLRRARRVPVRLLHARADLLGGRACSTRRGAAGRASWRDDELHRRGDPRADERQPVPLRRLREHRPRDRRGRAMKAVRIRAGRRDPREALALARAPARDLPRRRDQPRRPDEARRRDARRARRRHPPRPRPHRADAPTAACASARR